MYKITVVVSKQGRGNEALSVSYFGEDIEKVKEDVHDIALSTAEKIKASGRVTIGIIVEKHGKYYDSDMTDAIISEDFKNITYKL